MTEVDFLALKRRIAAILKADTGIFAQTTDATPETANSNRGKVGDDYYLKLRQIEVGEPDDLTSYTTPYCFITNANPREKDDVAGHIVAGVVSSSMHKIRLMVVVVDQQKSRQAVEISLDILHKLIKEALKANPYLLNPITSDDALAKFSHPALSENFTVSQDDKTFDGFMITLEIIKQTGA